MKNIPDLLQKQRIRKGYSQEYVAAQLDISQKAYSRIENGICRLEIERFLVIAEILELDFGLILSERNIKLHEVADCNKCHVVMHKDELHERIRRQESYITFLQHTIERLTK